MKKIAILIIICLALLPFIAADETLITVKVLPQYNYSITLNVLDPETGEAILPSPFENSTGTAGQVTIPFTSASRRITFSVLARQEGRIVINQKMGSFPNYSTGGTVLLDLFPPQNLTIPSNAITTASNATTTNTTANQTNSSANLTIPNITLTNIEINASGNFSSFFSFIPAIKWDKIKIWVYYSIGALLGIIVIFLAIKFLPKIRGAGHFSGSTASSKNETIRIITNPQVEKDLAEAQAKIKEAQATIENIQTRKQQILEARRKFDEAKKNLDNLETY